MINHGIWETYIPQEAPLGAPNNAIYWTDGSRDWYEFSRQQWNVIAGVDTTGTTKVAIIDGLVSCVADDVTRLALFGKFLLLELEEGEDIPELGSTYADGVFATPIRPEPVTVVYSVDLWTRLTEEEAEQVNGEMAQQSFRTRKIFESANSYRSDHDLWPLLQQIATTLFGAERAAQILAPSV